MNFQAGQFLITPLFSIIQNGDNIKDADFLPVSLGMAVACCACSFMIFYNIFLTSKLPKKPKQELSGIVNQNFDEFSEKSSL